MAIPQPNPRTVQAPPEVPFMPDVSNTLTQYLRSFALWCRHGFADKLSGTVAQPGIMLVASDPPAGTTPKVFMLQVNSAGAVTTTPMDLGSGAP